MKLKMHAERKLPYETTVHWTLCQRHVDAAQIAAFESGVNCKSCCAILEFNRECEAERAAREKAKGAQ